METVEQEKKEIETLIEELNRKRAIIRMIQRTEKARREEAMAWRDRREAIKAERLQIRASIAPSREERDRLNQKVSEYKAKRNKLHGEIRHLISLLREKAARRREIRKEKEKIALADELEHKIQELDWAYQTTGGLSREDEKKIVDQIIKLSEQLEEYDRSKKLVLEVEESLDSIGKQIDQRREEATRYHEKMLEFVEKAQEIHNSLKSSIEKMEELRRQEEEAHKKFVSIIKTLDPLRERRKKILGEMKVLQEKLAAYRALEVKKQQERMEKAKAERFEVARRKVENGEKLSLEELQLLLERGYPFGKPVTNQGGSEKEEEQRLG